MIQEAIDIIAFQSELKNVSVKMDCKFDRVDESWLQLDIQRIQQVMFNLLSNAIKFSLKDSTVDITLTVLPYIMYDTMSVKIEVRDYGTGMSPEQLDRSFEPFSRGISDQDREHNPSGNGLGLNICKRIVESFGGEIKAKSGGLNKGSKFTVTFDADIPETIPNTYLPGAVEILPIRENSGINLDIPSSHTES